MVEEDGWVCGSGYILTRQARGIYTAYGGLRRKEAAARVFAESIDLNLKL
jgi:hypothetical protein